MNDYTLSIISQLILRGMYYGKTNWKINKDTLRPWDINVYNKTLKELRKYAAKETKKYIILDADRITAFIKSHTHEQVVSGCTNYSLNELSYILNNPGKFVGLKIKGGYSLEIRTSYNAAVLSEHASADFERACYHFLEGCPDRAREEMEPVTRFLVQMASKDFKVSNDELPLYLGIDPMIDEFIDGVIRKGGTH